MEGPAPTGRRLITRAIIPGAASAPGYGRPPLRGEEFEVAFPTRFTANSTVLGLG